MWAFSAAFPADAIEDHDLPLTTAVEAIALDAAFAPDFEAALAVLDAAAAPMVDEAGDDDVVADPSAALLDASVQSAFAASSLQKKKNYFCCLKEKKKKSVCLLTNLPLRREWVQMLTLS